VRYHRIRRRIGEFFRHDWLEIGVVIFGVIVFALGVFATFVAVYSIVHFGESGGSFPATTSWLKSASGGAIALFSILALMCFIASWALVGKRVARSVATAIRSRRGGTG
jgi:protein-S-isoprenylcysteine O-methyltransferase Ste14